MLPTLFVKSLSTLFISESKPVLKSVKYIQRLCFKRQILEAGMMAQQLRAVTALTEDPGFDSQRPHGG